MPNPNSSLSDQHFTPPTIIEACRQVMGKIDLDPCTSVEVNNWSVKAPVIFTNHGIERLNLLPNSGYRAYVNPPSKAGTGIKSPMKLWLTECHKHWESGKISEMFFMMFNREFLGLPILEKVPMLHFEKRVKFWAWDNEEQCFKEGNYNSKGQWTNSPDRPSTLLYFPPNSYYNGAGGSHVFKNTELQSAFKDLGRWANLTH